MPDEEYISVAEAARLTGLSERQLTRLLRTETIPGRKPARDWLVLLSSVAEYLKQERKPGPKPRRQNH